MPRVSIIVATYNRSNVLRYAIESVRWQGVADWELLVVGDGCTDDTPAIVERFRDPRIRFTNLPRNHGEQSVPNNVGIAQAQGDCIAFLSHDDLWFPDHLEQLLDAIDRSGADFAYSTSARIDPRGQAHLWGNSPEGRYAFWHSVPASVWLMRRDVARRTGPWRSASTIFDAPSQDWIRRAAASGAVMQPVLRMTAVQITSGNRRLSYSNRDESEHAAVFAAMRDDSAYREKLLLAIANASSPMATYISPLPLAGRTLKAAAARACVAVGVPPVTFFGALRYGRRGGLIRALRRTRGLSPSFGDRR